MAQHTKAANAPEARAAQDAAAIAAAVAPNQPVTPSPRANVAPVQSNSFARRRLLASNNPATPTPSARAAAPPAAAPAAPAPRSLSAGDRFMAEARRAVGVAPLSHVFR